MTSAKTRLRRLLEYKTSKTTEIISIMVMIGCIVAIFAHHNYHKDYLLSYYDGILVILIGLQAWIILGNRLRFEQLTDQANFIAGNELRYRYALEGSGQGIWDWDIANNHLFTSSGLNTLLGYADDEVGSEPRPWLELIHPEDRPLVIDAFQDRIADRTPTLQYEARIRCQDGSWKWVQTRGMVATRDRNQHPRRLIGTMIDISVEKELREHLKATTAMLSSIFESSPFGIALVDATDYRFLKTNAKYASITGIPHHELERKTWMEIVNPNNAAAAAEFVGNIMTNLEAPRKYSRKHVRSDGSAVYLNVTLASVGNSNREHHPALLIMAEDVSELEQAQEYFQNILDSINAIVVEFDTDNIDITYITRQARQVIGYSETECQRPGFFQQQLHPDDRARVVASLASCATQHNSEDFDFRLAHRNGHYLWLRSVIHPIKDSMSVTRIHGIMVDITQRKRQEERLKESDRHLAMLMDTAREAIISVSENHIIRFFNNGARDMFGYAAAEVIGQNFAILLPSAADSTKNLEIACPMSRKESGNSRLQIQARRKSGSTFPAEGSFTITETSQGPLYTVILSDMSERVQAEERIRYINASLEARIRERTHDLEMAKKEAEAANQAKSAFLSNMSHEIRTPLNSIIGMTYLAQTHLAQKAALDTKQQGYLDAISLSGKHLLRLVNNILDISRIEAGMFLLDKNDFATSQIQESLIKTFAAKFAEKNIALTIEIDPTLPAFLKGDLQRLNQVLFNFVGNALKFTRQGQVTVRASRQPDLGDPLQVRFDVTDTGIGIKPEHINKIFNVFEQGDNSITRLYGGSGLGLAISLELIELMGGEVGVTSQPGEGSHFWFTVHLEKGTGAPAEEKSPEHGEDGMVTSLHGLHILLVEDNLFNQQVAIELLEQEGAVVVVAANGVEALELLDRFQFDCVLMDMQMPVMGGIEAARSIRARPAIADIPIIAMTANASELDRASCLAAGMNDFITKPVTPAALYQAVARSQSGPARHEATANTFPESSCPEESAGPATAGYHEADDVDLLDLGVLAEMVGFRQESIERFAHKFIETTAAALTELDTALQAGNIDLLADIGHRLKSSAATVGAHRLTTLCIQLEALRHDGTLDQARTLCAGISSVFALTKADMEESLASGSSQPAPVQGNLPTATDMHRVLVVDDEDFQLDYVKSLLTEIGIREIACARNGQEAFALFTAANPDLVICDLHIPWADGIELLRKFGTSQYRGGILLVSGMDQSQLRAAEALAVQFGLNVLGAMQKPLRQSALQGIIDGLTRNNG